MRWGVDAGPRLPKKISTKGTKNHQGAPRALALLGVLLILTQGTPRLPPSGLMGRGVCPPPARLRAPPSSPTPPQGGSDTGAPYAGLRYHSPLEGESQKPSRQAKADAEGGGRRPAKLRPAATPLSPKPQPAAGVTILK